MLKLISVLTSSLFLIPSVTSAEVEASSIMNRFGDLSGCGEHRTCPSCTEFHPKCMWAERGCTKSILDASAPRQRCAPVATEDTVVPDCGSMHRCNSCTQVAGCIWNRGQCLYSKGTGCIDDAQCFNYEWECPAENTWSSGYGGPFNQHSSMRPPNNGNYANSDMSNYDYNNYDTYGNSNSGNFYNNQGIYSNFGYNDFGYNSNGYNSNGYNNNDYNNNGYNSNGYNDNGYNIDGYNINGYNNNGYNIIGNRNRRGRHRGKRNQGQRNPNGYSPLYNNYNQNNPPTLGYDSPLGRGTEVHAIEVPASSVTLGVGVY